MLTRIAAHLRALVFRRRIESEIDEELRYHVERAVEEYVASGMTPAEARRVALAELGGLPQTRESVHAVRGAWIDALRQALSLRGARHQPAYALAFALTLMIAIAAATTIGAVIKPVLFDPLPYRDDGTLVMINAADPAGLDLVNVHTFNDLRDSAPPLSAITGARGGGGSLTTPEGVFAVSLGHVGPTYFETLGVTPAIGRVWDAHDTTGVVIAWRFWKEQLKGSEDVIGRTINIDGVDRVVLGILPRRFVAPWNQLADVLMPLDPAPLLADPYRARRRLIVLARRAPGVSLEQVNAHLAVFSTRMENEHPNVPGGQTLAATPLREVLVGNSGTVIRGMTAATLLLLLIVIANITGLAAVRAIAVRQQTAVKIALGASRGRIVLERLGESLLLALAGALAGAGLSALLVQTLRGYQDEFLWGLPPIELTASLLVTMTIAGTVVGAVAGLVPQLTFGRRGGENPLRAARGSAGDRTSARLRMALASAQIALALVMIVGAGLLGRTLGHLAATPLGFDPDRLSAFFVSLSGPRYPRPAQVQFERDMLERLARIPGVEAVTASIGIPISGGMGASLYIRGREEQGTPIHYMSVAPNFQDLVGMRLIEGRTLDTRDVMGSPGALLVNETMARRFWPDGDAVGARVFVGVAPSDNWMTIVGIVSDVRQHGPDEDVMPTAFGSTRQYSWPMRNFTFRSAAGYTVAPADLRAALRDVDPLLVMRNLSTMRELVTGQQGRQRLVLFVLSSFAVVAVVLCAFGLYGVLALTSSLRRREYAIRLALGSTAERVRWLVVRQAIVLAGAGLAAGLAIAWVTTRTLQGLLHGVQPNDPATLAGAAIAIVVLALAASWLPARRAAAVNGAEVLASDAGV